MFQCAGTLPGGLAVVNLNLFDYYEARNMPIPPAGQTDRKNQKMLLI
jgi:hypothetical protein